MTPYDLRKNYGVQSFDQKLIFNTFIVYETPWYKNQRGLIGRAAGGWTISPVIVAGTGQPLTCNTNSGSQSFGGADAANFTDKEQCVFTTPYTGGYHTPSRCRWRHGREQHQHRNCRQRSWISGNQHVRQPRCGL